MTIIRNFVLRSIVLVIGLFLFSSCSHEPKTKADNLKEHMSDSTIGHVPLFVKRSKMVFVNEPVKNEKSPTFTAKRYVIDIERSELEWFCSRHTGFVKFKSGALIVENGKFSKGDFSINMDSIFNTDIDNNLMRGTLDNILKSDELFDVRKFPEAGFSITDVKNVDGNEFVLSGILNLMNVSKQIKFRSFMDINGDTLKAKSEQFIIDRTVWGITNMSKKYAKSKDEFIVTDSIRFIVHIKAYAKQD